LTGGIKPQAIPSTSQKPRAKKPAEVPAFEWNSAVSKPNYSQGMAMRKRQREYMIEVQKTRKETHQFQQVDFTIDNSLDNKRCSSYQQAQISAY